MLHIFFDMIRELGHASRFETYYRNLMSNGLPGAPTVDEARQDYQDIDRSMSQYPTF